MAEKKSGKSFEEIVLKRLDNLESKIGWMQEVVQTQLSYIGKSPGFEITEQTSFIEFQIDTQFFCFKIDDIKEIIRIIALTEIPDSPEILEGVINFRGELIPIVDFRYRIEVEPKQYELDYNIIIFNVDDFYAGIIVDKVTEVNEIQPEQIEPPVEAPFQKSFIQGMVKKDGNIVMIINPRMLLSVDEKEKVDQLLQQENLTSDDSVKEKVDAPRKRSTRKGKKK